MHAEKNLMMEAAILYYEKNRTQQEIAQMLRLSRQTVSKLLSSALAEGVVEIRIHDPQRACRDLEEQLCRRFGLRSAVVCSVSGRDPHVRQLMTVRSAAAYLQPILEDSGLHIAISWGRTLQALIEELPPLRTEGNTVFPLFGATDTERSCFLSNELARGFADKIGAEAKYAWFPYQPDQAEDCTLLKKTSYYKKIQALWEQVDVALVGIGNMETLQRFERLFGYHAAAEGAVGDLATHLFTADGTLIAPYANALCASAENLKQARETIAVACSSDGDDKTAAITGALYTGIIDTLVTDEHTARQVLDALPIE